MFIIWRFTHRETRYRQLFAKQLGDGSFVDFRKVSDLSMEEFEALIERIGSLELREGVSVATDVSSEVNFQRLEKATSLLLEGTYFSEDIDVCVEAVQELYAENAGIISIHIISSIFGFLFGTLFHLSWNFCLQIVELTALGEVSVEFVRTDEFLDVVE